jgi:hypothetical protein
MLALAARRELGGGVRQHPGSTTALTEALTKRAVVTRAREAAPIPARSASRPTCLTCSGRLGGAAAAGRRRQFFLAELLLADSGADDGARAIGADADRLRLVGAAAMVPAPIERSEVRGHRQQIGKSAALTVGQSRACSLSDISGWRDGVLYPLAGGRRRIRRGAFWRRRRAMLLDLLGPMVRPPAAPSISTLVIFRAMELGRSERTTMRPLLRPLWSYRVDAANSPDRKPR